ncbi:MAG: hypothetical protein JXA68_10540, partial [Ignavibacteriales bacterium]|nr:hypothetical protein [Ignavibacteriales bacterium]
MLFADRRYEDGNVHRRVGVSKTVTKNVWVGFFKNLIIKAPPDLSDEKAGNPAESERKLTAVSAVS